MSLVALVPGLWLALLAAAGAWALGRLDGDLPRRVSLAALGLTLAVLAGPLLAGRVLASPDLAAMPPWGGDVEAGRRAAASAPAARVLPATVEVRRALRAGEPPWWNPRAGAGQPLLADPGAQLGQPLVAAAWPLSYGRALGATAGLQVFVALVFGWLALRDLPTRPGPPPGDGAAFAGAAVYALGGVLPLHGWPEAHVAALFPALLYALGAAERRGRRRDRLLAIAVGAAVLLSGAPRAAALALAAALAFQLVHFAGRPPAGRVRPFARTVAVLALAAGLAAPVLLPQLRWLPRTEAEVRRAAERREVLREDPVGLRTLRGTWGPRWRGDEPAPPWEPLGRGGVLFLAAVALVHRPVRRRGGAAWRVAAGAGLVAAVAVAAPAAATGVLRYLRLDRGEPAGGPAWFLLHFALACLVALALAASAGPRRRRPGKLAVVLAAVLAAGALWATAAAGPPGAGGLALPRAAAGLAVAAGAAAAGAGGAPLLGAVAVVEAAVAAVPATIPAEDFYRPHPVVAALGHVAGAERGLRSVPLGPGPRPAVTILQGLPDARGVPGLRPAGYAELVRALESSPGEWLPAAEPLRAPLYDLLSVHALLPPGGGVPQARPSALPLLFLPAETRPAGPDGWLPEVLAVDDFARTAVVGDGPRSRGPWRAADPGAGRVVAGAPGRGRLAARTDLAEERLLASSIYQDGGWRVLVDGRPVPTTVANGPFVAVWLPAGSRRVELVYRPPGLTAGLVCAAAAVLGAAAWLLPWRRRRRPAR